MFFKSSWWINVSKGRRQRGILGNLPFYSAVIPMFAFWFSACILLGTLIHRRVSPTCWASLQARCPELAASGSPRGGRSGGGVGNRRRGRFFPAEADEFYKSAFFRGEEWTISTVLSNIFLLEGGYLNKGGGGRRGWAWNGKGAAGERGIRCQGNHDQAPSQGRQDHPHLTFRLQGSGRVSGPEARITSWPGPGEDVLLKTRRTLG